jgi:hypothetical protein
LFAIAKTNFCIGPALSSSQNLPGMLAVFAERSGKCFAGSVRSFFSMSKIARVHRYFRDFPTRNFVGASTIFCGILASAAQKMSKILFAQIFFAPIP